MPACGKSQCWVQVGPDPYWGAAGLVGTSSAELGTQLDNNTVAAPFGGIAVTAFAQEANLPPAQFGKSAHVNVTGMRPAAPRQQPAQARYMLPYMDGSIASNRIVIWARLWGHLLAR